MAIRDAAQAICGRDVKLVQSDSIKVPMAAGYFRPVILFPTRELSEGITRCALRHEWSHYKSRDTWGKLIVNIMCCLMWWNPLVYLLRKDLDPALEIRCDMDVTTRMTEAERLDYYDSILQLYRQIKEQGNRSPDLLATSFVSAKRDEQLKQRFRLGMANHDIKRSRRANAILCVILVAVMIISYAFVLQPASMPEFDDDGFIYYAISPENSYLVDNNDGTYSMYIDGAFVDDITSIDIEPFSELPIRKEP